MSEFVYTCPACKTGYFLSANAEPPWFAACPKCGHLVVTAGGQQDSPSIPAIDADYWRTRAERAEAENAQLKAQSKEQAEEATKQVRRLWNAIIRAHNILYASCTTEGGKYGGKYQLAALDAKNILFDAMEGGEG
jgi:hypothetical protein